MGTVVLRSYDPLRHQRIFSPPNLRRCNQCLPRRRKRSPIAVVKLLPSDNPDSAMSSPSRNLVMGKVRILKRGEDLKLVTVASPGSVPDDLVLCSPVRASDLYAGAACSLSPPPSSLPFPAALVTGVRRRDVCGDS